MRGAFVNSKHATLDAGSALIIFYFCARKQLNVGLCELIIMIGIAVKIIQARYIQRSYVGPSGDEI